VSEHTEQCALFEWATWNEARIPELALLMHIPNGGKRSRGVAGQLKAAGVKAGVPDLFLPVARHGAHGLWIELKVGRNRLSREQREWLLALQRQGYDAHAVFGWQDAARLLCLWLGADPAAHGLASPSSVEARL
jgi:hypothetical protein